jgi:hypothetical protein
VEATPSEAKVVEGERRATLQEGGSSDSDCDASRLQRKLRACGTGSPGMPAPQTSRISRSSDSTPTAGAMIKTPGTGRSIALSST